MKGERRRNCAYIPAPVELSCHLAANVEVLAVTVRADQPDETIISASAADGPNGAVRT